MSGPRKPNPAVTLDEVLSGRLDSLSPEQIRQLEAYLAADSAAADALAAVRPPAIDLPDEPLPDERQWRALWTRIEQGLSRGRPPARGIGLWRTVAAAAACGLAMVAWNRGMHTAMGSIRLARDVVIESMEVGHGESAFVVYLDEGSGPPVVWVIDASQNGDG